MGASMTMRRSIGNKSTSVVNGLFHAVRRFFALLGDVTPDLKKCPLWQVE
jgi:hypothetical protein